MTVLDYELSVIAVRVEEDDIGLRVELFFELVTHVKYLVVADKFKMEEVFTA